MQTPIPIQRSHKTSQTRMGPIANLSVMTTARRGVAWAFLMACVLCFILLWLGNRFFITTTLNGHGTISGLRNESVRSRSGLTRRRQARGRRRIIINAEGAKNRGGPQSAENDPIPFHITCGNSNAVSCILTSMPSFIRPSALLMLLASALPLHAQVTTTADSVPGSLRQVIAEAPAGSVLTFAPHLSGQTLLLTNGQILVTKSIVLDASALADGVIIDGQGQNRLFHCGSQTTNTFLGLTLTGGGTSGDGGAILNFFNLTMSHCTVVANEAFFGGGISNCDTLHLHNSIVAGNTASVESQIGGPIATSTGANLTSGDPMLAPLGDHGGPTRTMPPLPGSPAVDPPGGDLQSAFPTDQRGMPRVVGERVDIGAVEFQGASDVTRFWPTDWDGDGSPFGWELALGLDPLQADTGQAGTPKPYPPGIGNGIEFGFNDAATNYVAWVVKRSFNVSVPGGFVEIYRFDGPTGATMQAADLSTTRSPQHIRIVDETQPRPLSSFYLLCIEPRF